MLDLLGAVGQGAPDETLLLTLVNCELKLKDRGGYVDALERLVASHPKHDYWADLSRAMEQKPGFAPRLRLDLDRLEVAVGAMTAPDQYVEAAVLALAAGFPGDAGAFLAKGYEAGEFSAPAARGADRQKRLADHGEKQSDDDAKGLAQQKAEASASKSGVASEKLGEANASYGRFPDAIAALEQSLAKGGLDHPDDARLHLGVVYLRAGDMQKAARDARSPIKGTDGTADLARLWLIADGK